MLKALLTILLLSVAALSQNTITVGGSSFQTMRGWQATAQVAQQYNTTTGAYQWPSSTYPNYKANLRAAIMDLGLDSLRIEFNVADVNATGYSDNSSNAAIQPSTATSGQWRWDRVDSAMTDIYVPMAADLAGIGEAPPTIILCFVDFKNTGYAVEASSSEYAFMVNKVVDHIYTTYGVRPNRIEAILEMDNQPAGTSWTAANVANGIVAADALLTSNGHTGIRWSVPSTTSGPNASTYYSNIKAANASVAALIDEVGYHQYTPLDDAGRAALASAVEADGNYTAMNECAGNSGCPSTSPLYFGLVSDLTLAHIASWQQYTITFPYSGQVYGVNDYKDQYLFVNLSTWAVSLNNPAKYLRHFFKYVRRGAVMKSVTNSSPLWQGIPFVNTNGKYVVPITSSAAGTVSVTGLPAGTYGRCVTIGDGLNAPTTYNSCASNVVVTGPSDSVPVTFSGSGVGTVYDINYLNPPAPVDYYASPSGSGSTCSIGSPCSLATALGKTLNASDTIQLRGGTYSGKFTSALTAGTVKSYPGEWAVLDGYVHTTLTAGIDSSTLVLPVASTANWVDNQDVAIEGEAFHQCAITSSTTLTCATRNASGTIIGPVAHQSGANVILGGTTLLITGSGTTYRDLEVTNSNPYRNVDFFPGAISYGNGIWVLGDSNKVVNVLVHDTLDGANSGSASSNTEFYGVIAYNNGMYSPANRDGNGHGLYLENASGYSRVYNTLSLNNFNLGMQGFGQTGPYVGGDIDRSVFVGSGSPLGFLGVVGNINLVYGPNSVQSPTGSVTNSHFFHQHSAAATLVNLGYAAGVGNLTATGNYFVGGETQAQVSNVTAGTFTGNTIYSRSAFKQYTLVNPTAPTGTWNSNTYYKDSGAAIYTRNGVGAYTFANWKTATGFDAGSTASAADMPDTVIVNPNTYETGRATVVIYAPSAPATISVNLSTAGLTNGQAYTIRNAFDFMNSVVMTGTYNSASPSVSVPLTGSILNVATPIGTGYRIPTTCPDLCVLIVQPGTWGDTNSDGVLTTKRGWNTATVIQ